MHVANDVTLSMERQSSESNVNIKVSSMCEFTNNSIVNDNRVLLSLR